jgi:hypothetical protein
MNRARMRRALLIVIGIIIGLLAVFFTYSAESHGYTRNQLLHVKKSPQSTVDIPQ